MTTREVAFATGYMNTQEFKAMQGPLKAKYRENPESAVITLHAEALASDGIACGLDTGSALVEAGLHQAAGADGSQACSGDMLLQALAACAGVTLTAVYSGVRVKAVAASAPRRYVY